MTSVKFKPELVTVFFHVENDYLSASIEGKEVGRLTTQLEVEQFGRDMIERHGLGCVTFMCSSSLDFPWEYTSRQVIVDLCDFIRGGKSESREEWLAREKEKENDRR